MKTIPVFLIAIFLLVGCDSPQPHLGKCKTYLYKESVSSDGLICVFYSSNEFVAEGNARIFAEMHEEKFGIPLIVSKKPF